MLKQGLDLRCKRKQSTVPIVIERLNSEPVSRAKERFLLCVPKGECEHSSETTDTRDTVLLIGMNDCFSVTTGGVAVTGLFQNGAKRHMIEDLAIIDNPNGAGFIGHRLMSAAEINDAKPA